MGIDFKTISGFKTVNGMNNCATSAKPAQTQAEVKVKFQNRKRYEQLRNGVYLEIISNATSKFVLENDFDFGIKCTFQLEKIFKSFL